MRILWLDINSSYSHSSVALPAIHAQVSSRKDWEWSVVRGTINDNPGAIAAAAAEQKPDIIAATFWLFTHNMQIEVLSRLVQLINGVKIICGGPEFLGDNSDFLVRHKFITAIIRGEGEIAFPKLLEVIDRPESWESIEGLCWIADGRYHDNGTARVMDFASLKYPEESRFFNWDKPFVQLETARGCFNTCAFCVSGGEKPVRYQSLKQIRSRLENIHSHGIKDIRILDRTFNYDTERACEMLDIFACYKGKMRFHLEIHPSLLTDALKQKIALLPVGLLHLEAGMQSLDSSVLKACGRKGSDRSSMDGLTYMASLDNVETHADLIAGLPLYSLEMLCHDIRTLIGIGVDELQVESLKVLPGTLMRNQALGLGLKYSPTPPYEILRTPDVSASQLQTAMQISRVIDLYYNSVAWQEIFRDLVRYDNDFLIAFTEYLKGSMVLESPVSLERRGMILYGYCKEHYPEKAADVSIAWIRAGFSLKKEPAGEITKVKHLHAFLSENRYSMTTVYGQAEESHRYYLMKSQGRKVMFGYDSETHQPAPSFMASVE